MHFAEIYGASVSRNTISRITDKVIEEMNDWTVRPLDETYAAIFIDAIVGQGSATAKSPTDPPFYAADRGSRWPANATSWGYAPGSGGEGSSG